MSTKDDDKRPGKPGGIRALAREQMNREIKRLAWEQLRETGPSGLSLRAISREMGMTSSALYRYFENRDALLTALIIDAYNELADRLETADAAITEDLFHDRLVSIGTTLLSWGEENPHRFALVYGSPIPGYVAPPDTLDPGIRPTLALGRVLSAWATSRDADPPLATKVPTTLRKQLEHIARDLPVETSPALILWVISTWSELMGIAYSRFFNHFGPDAGALAQWQIERLANRCLAGKLAAPRKRGHAK